MSGLAMIIQLTINPKSVQTMYIASYRRIKSDFYLFYIEKCRLLPLEKENSYSPRSATRTRQPSGSEPHKNATETMRVTKKLRGGQESGRSAYMPLGNSHKNLIFFCGSSVYFRLQNYIIKKNILEKRHFNCLFLITPNSG